MRTFYIAALLVLLAVATWSIEPRSKGEHVDSQAITADSLLKAADATFKASEYESALKQYAEASEMADKEFNNSVKAEALAQMARMNLILGNKEQGRELLGQAATVASDSDPMGWSRYLGVRGRFEWKDDDLKAARVTFDEMYTYCTVNALWGRAVDAAHMIAIVAETPQEQLEWGRKGIEAAEAGEVESWLGPLWNNMAITYSDIKQYDSSLACFLKAREYHWRYSGEVAKLFADYHVGMTHRFLGNYEEARKWLRPVLAWAERLENHGAIGQACEDLGEADIAEGKTTEGLKWLMRARSEYKLEGYDSSWPQIWDSINKRISELEQ